MINRVWHTTIDVIDEEDLWRSQQSENQEMAFDSEAYISFLVHGKGTG